jgi:hypothetical protein
MRFRFVAYGFRTRGVRFALTFIQLLNNAEHKKVVLRMTQHLLRF